MEYISEVFQTLFKYAQTIKFSDIADIAIIAYFIYRLLILIRRTSAAQVAKGILFLVAVMWLSSLFELNVLKFVINKAMELGALALIIMFQPELRRMLEHVGSSSLGSFFTKEVTQKEMERTIMQTVNACVYLSRLKIGALIVFEKHIKLDEIIKSGTEIDAEVTGELIKNIFYPRAPLHGGAVIIRNGRIDGAGCVLPLSANTNLSRDLGMRHRAGIGMSEHSDALVVIVSEETGSLSVATDGKLRRHLATETFEKILRKELMPEETGETLEKAASFLNIFKVKKNDKRNAE